MVECPKVLGRPPRVRAPVPLVAKEHQVRAEPSWKKLLKMFEGNVVLLFFLKKGPPTQSCQVHVRHGAAQEGRRGGRGLRTVRPWEKGNCCLYILRILVLYLFGCAGATEKNDLTLWSWSHMDTLDLQNIFLSVNLHFSGKPFVVEPTSEPPGLTPAAGPL